MIDFKTIKECNIQKKKITEIRNMNNVLWKFLKYPKTYEFTIRCSNIFGSATQTYSITVKE